MEYVIFGCDLVDVNWRLFILLMNENIEMEFEFVEFELCKVKL